MKKIALPLIGLLGFSFYLHSQDEEDKVNQEVIDDAELKEAGTYLNLSENPSFLLEDLAAKAISLINPGFHALTTNLRELGFRFISLITQAI